MSGLTKAQRELLECCHDWTSPWDVAEARRAKGRVVFSRSTAAFMNRMHSAGLLKYCRSSEEYRITDAGLALLRSLEVRDE